MKNVKKKSSKVSQKICPNTNVLFLINTVYNQSVNKTSLGTNNSLFSVVLPEKFMTGQKFFKMS